MSNQSSARPVVDMEDIIFTIQSNVCQLVNLVTLLDNISVNLDLLLTNPELSVAPGRSRNKVILVRDTVQLARDLADTQTNDLDVYRERLALRHGHGEGQP